MRLELDAPVLALATGELLALDDARGTRILPRRGTVWITEEGEPQDFIVGPGESFLVTRDGRTLVQAMAPVNVTLRAPRSVLAANDTY